MERHSEYPPSFAPRRILMAMAVCAFVAALFSLPPAAGAQPADDAAALPIIVFAPEHAAGASASRSALTAEQAATLETIRSDPVASGIRLGHSAPTAIAAALDARALSMVVPAPSASGASPSGASLAADAVVAFTGVDVERNSGSPGDGGDLVSLYARDDATDSEVALVVQGPDVLGSIRRGAEVYKVHPLGDGLTAVYRYDTSRLRRHPPGWGWLMRRNEPTRRQAPQAPDAPPSEGAGTSVLHDRGSARPPDAPPSGGAGTSGGPASGAAADTGDVIDLMVAYTPAARTGAGNIDALIQLAIDNTHRIYRNSGIGFRLRLVHKHQVSYTEASKLKMDLDHLTRDFDGVMDEVHDLRDRYGADLVALIVGQSNACGVAWVPNFGAGPDLDWSNQGFSVTVYNCETMTNYTFAHELGHNQGASHDPDNTCRNPPCSLPSLPTFPYRHGRCNTAEGWNTVMSYRSSDIRGDCRREIEYFSSPTLDYRGTPTGDAARRDNRRVLLETARRVANYRRSVNTTAGHVLPYVLAERTAGRQGFVRIVNRSARAGAVTLTAIDDAGRTAGTETLDLAANGAIHFNSRDLERGNAAKGFSGVGPGAGDWRLVLTSTLDVQPLAYVRTADGFVTRIDDVEAEAEDGGNRYVVHFFNPGRNLNQRSSLRLINPGTASARITITAHDDAGTPRGPVSLDLPAGQARRLTAVELETGGQGFEGRLGTGSGKWRLTVEATRPVQVMSLLQTSTGHLTNLSGVPTIRGSVTPPPPPSAPDLVVQPPSVSDDNLNAGQTFTLRATVRNQGEGRSATTTLRYYISSDATISASDTRVGTDAVGALSASGTSSESITLRAPSSAGAWYYGACVDAVPGESGTRNNCSAGARVTVTVPTTGPDLVIGTITLNVYRSIRSGLWSAYVHNRGDGDSPATTLRLTASGRTLATGYVEAIPTWFPRDFVYGRLETGLPAVGETVRFCVDPVQGELDTANNCKAYSVLSSVASADAPGAGPEAEALRAFEQRHRILRQHERAQMALERARAGAIETAGIRRR